MAKIQDGLSDAQAFSLIFETTSARNLLAYGVRALRTSAFHETTIDPVMTMLSIGVEKHQKMALGLISVADSGRWPDKAVFKKTWGHDLVLMHEVLARALRARLHLATHRSYVEPLLDAIDQDSAWEPLLQTLSRYGQQGRFYHLDALAEDPQPGDRPDAYWDQAERAAMETDPGLTTLFHASAKDVSMWDEFTRRLNERMALSITGWWEAVCVTGRHGMLGERGKGWGFDAHPDAVGRQVRDSS